MIQLREPYSTQFDFVLKNTGRSSNVQHCSDPPDFLPARVKMQGDNIIKQKIEMDLGMKTKMVLG